MQTTKQNTINTINNTVTTSVLVKAAKRLPTYKLIYILVDRHKLFITGTCTVILILNYIFPPWFDIFKTLILSQ